jgi:hypothetical protein
LGNSAPIHECYYSGGVATCAVPAGTMGILMGMLNRRLGTACRILKIIVFAPLRRDPPGEDGPLCRLNQQTCDMKPACHHRKQVA